MGNLITYLKWRGDFSLCNSPFCEVDNAVLSVLSYVCFEECISEEGEITIEQAAKIYFTNEKMKMMTQWKDYEELFYQMAGSRRFQKSLLSGYISVINEETQFSALQIRLEDGTIYIAFRGTDESIAGWREDFSMSFRIIVAQELSLKYLEEHISGNQCIYRIGGHSKGGNLAIFASTNCSPDKKKNILKIYNNDGPGICPEMYRRQDFLEIKNKVICFIPAFSIIGRLFEMDVETYIVGSSANEFLQHDCMTWEVEGDHFVRRDIGTGKCEAYSRIIKEWMEGATRDQREAFTKDFFDALGANGATQMLDIPADGFDGFGTILVALIESENRTKIAVKNLFKTVFSYLKRMDMKAALHKKQGMQGLGLFLLGILFICFPKFAVNGIGTGIMAVGFLWSARKLLGTALCEDMERIRKRRRLLAEMFFMSLFAVLVFQKNVLTITINLAIGSLLLVYAYMKSKKIFSTKEKNRYGKVFGGFMAVMSFMLGMVSLATPDWFFAEKTLAIGSFLAVYGAGKILWEMVNTEI